MTTMKFGRRVRNVRNLLVTATIAVTLGGMTWIAVGNPEQAGLVSGGAALLIAAGAFLLDVFDQLRPGRASPPVDEVADQLTEAVRDQWRAEATARGLRDSSVLPLRWAASTRKVGDAIEAVVPDTGGRPIRARWHGGIRDEFEDALVDLAAEYAKIPSGRLVLLGEPGAGKTVLALLLTLGLINARQPGGRVPVLLSVSDWDPVLEEADDWIIGALAANYYNGQTDIPRELLRSDRLIPVLDGLDEIPETSRRVAVEKINLLVRRDRPVVVTCRTNEYEDSIADGSPALSRAPVIEVQPVTVDDLETYLGHHTWPAGTTWTAVLNRIRNQPKGPLALALSTPLTVSLARLVYSRLPEKPAELLDEERFDSRHAIEDSLAARTVRAAYTDPDTLEQDARAAKAERYLTALAKYLHQHRERDFAWWKLADRRLSVWAGPTIGITAGLLLMTVVAAWVSWFGPSDVPVENTLIFGASVGGLLAVLITVVWLARSGKPGRIGLRLAGSGKRLRAGFRAGVVALAVPAVAVLLGLALTISIAGSWALGSIEPYVHAVSGSVALALLIGTAFAVPRWINAGDGPASPTDPAESVKLDRRLSLVSAAVSAIIVGGLLIPAVVGGLWLGSMGEDLLTNWSGWPGAPDPGAVWSARLFDVTERFVPSRGTMIAGLVVLPALLTLILSLLSRPWPRFVIVTTVLAARGQLPWRLSRFLEDAHGRGLLRRSAGAYQFRHVRLQEQLVTNATEASKSPGSVRARWASGSLVARAAAVAAVVLVGTALLVGTLPQNTARATLPGNHSGHVIKFKLYKEESGRPYSFAFSGDGRSIAVYNETDARIRVFSTQEKGELKRAFDFRRPKVKVRQAWLNHDGSKVFAIGEIPHEQHSDGFGVLWDVGSGAAREFDLGTDADESEVSFSRDGASLAMLTSQLHDGSYRFVMGGVDAEPLVDRRVNDVLISGDDVVIIEPAGGAELWRMGAANPVTNFGGVFTENGSDEISFLHETLLINFDADGGAKLYSVADGRPIADLGEGVGSSNDVVLNVEAQRAITKHSDGSFHVWRLERPWRETARTTRVEEDFRATDIDVSFGVMAALTDSGKVYAWRSDGKLIRELLLPFESVQTLAVDAALQGLTVIEAKESPSAAVRWLIPFDKTMPPRQLAPEKESISWLNDSSSYPTREEVDGVIALPTVTGTINLWSRATEECLGGLVGHAGPIAFLDASPTGNVLASSSNDGTVRLWPVPLKRDRDACDD